MRALVTLNRVLTLAMIAVVLCGASVAAAQEATAAAAETGEPALQGVSTLMLLLGLAGVMAVSLVWIMRERSADKGDETP